MRKVIFVEKFWLSLNAGLSQSLSQNLKTSKLLSGSMSAALISLAGWTGAIGTGVMTTSIATLLAPMSAEAVMISSWQFDPTTNQLELVLPDNVTPRYFLVAEPARIVVDLANTDFGSNPTQRTYPGAIAEVQVGQFQPGITRIVLRLAPGTVLAPGQVEIQQVSTDPSQGVTRWVLRPLLADATGSNTAQTTSTTATTTATAPATATPQSTAAPQSTARTQPSSNAEASSAQNQSAQPNSLTNPRTEQARTRAERRAQARAEAQARREAQQQRQANQRSSLGADSFPTPNLAQLPNSQSPSASAQPLPPATFDNHRQQMPTVVVPGTRDFGSTQATPSPSLRTAEGLPTTALNPPTNETALNPSGNNRVLLQSTTTQATAQATGGVIPSSRIPSQPTLIAAAQIIDFGQPLPLPGRPLPPNGGSSGGGVIGSGQVLVPSGTTLRLRYDGQDPLDIFPNDSVEEVLTLEQELRDRSGFTVFPQGSSVFGRFISNDQGEAQFIMQSISFSGQNYTLRGESDALTGERQVDRSNLLRNSAIGAVAGIGLAAITGVGIVPAILGGAALGAAGTYSGSPAEAPIIQPNQVIEVRTIEDLLRQ